MKITYSIAGAALFLSFILPARLALAQEVEPERKAFAGTVGITNNGVSQIPSFTLGKPAVLFKDTLIKSTSISASLSRVKDDMLASSESAKNTADSGRLGREAPFGRQTETRWLCHSSLCGAYHIASSFLASAPLSASESLRT